MMNAVLLVLAGSGAVSAVATAVAWMVVRLGDARALKQMVFKSIEDCPPEKRPANIKAVGQLAGQMFRDHPPEGVSRLLPGARKRSRAGGAGPVADE